MKIKIGATAVLFLGLAAAEARVPDFGGGLESIGYEFLRAKALELKFLPTAKEVHASVARGVLLPLYENPNLKFVDVSFQYSLPTTRLFVDWLEPDYRSHCLEDQMVVTSGTRPIELQPDNAHALSVHPTGMAVDLRVPPTRCTEWFRETLFALRDAGTINVIREMHPPHYHIAVFPDKILSFLSTED